LAPIELNGVLYSSARQDFSHAAGLSLVENLRSLIASQYAEADRAICGRGNFIQMLGRNWEVVVDQVPTAQNKKQKL